MSRLSLATQAKIWRGLENIGMGIERWTGPTQASYSFTKTVTISEPFIPGTVDLYFYIPPEYIARKPKDRFPTFLNFHGGGFTIGDATDDARWAHDVIRHLDAIFVSVNYRLAPEYPYPVAVQDGACVLQYLATHAEELGIDTERVVTCGFSAGGTLSVSSPMLYNALHDQHDSNPYWECSTAVPESWFPEHAKAWAKEGRCNVKAVVSFYPALDFTLTREQRRITNPSPSHNLSQMLTGLFDASFLPLPENALPPDPSMMKDKDAVQEMAQYKTTSNPTLTLTGMASDGSDDLTLSRTTSEQRDALSRITTADPSADMTPASSRALSRTSSTLSQVIAEGQVHEPGRTNGTVVPSLRPSDSDPAALESSQMQYPPTHSGLAVPSRDPMQRILSSRSARPSPVKMASSLIGRTTSARPQMGRTRSTLSIRSFRSYQGDRTRPHVSSPNLESPSSSEQPIAALFDPFLSPAQATSSMLAHLLPNDFVLYTCEFDMLQAEGERFAATLATAGKRVCYKKVSRVPHAWDKSPGIISWGSDAAKGREKVTEVYIEVCGLVGAILGIDAKVVDDIRKGRSRPWLWRRGTSKKDTSSEQHSQKHVTKKQSKELQKAEKQERKSMDKLEMRQSKELARQMYDNNDDDATHQPAHTLKEPKLI